MKHLSDDTVDALAEHGTDLTSMALAHEVRDNRKLRATCPTCGGVGHLGPATGAQQADYGRACPDCEDGLLTVEATIKLLVDTLRDSVALLDADLSPIDRIESVLASLPKENR